MSVNQPTPSGSLESANNSVTTNVNNFNSSHSYVTFSPQQPTATNDPASSIFSVSPLNFMSQNSEYDTNNPVSMSLLDNNIYDMDTAAYNSSLYFAAMKRQEQTAIRSGDTVITTGNGLRYVTLPAFCNQDTGFFQRTDSIATGNEGFDPTEGFGNRNSSSSRIEGFNGGGPKKNVVEGMSSGGNSQIDGLTCIIVDGYMNDDINYFNGKTPRNNTPTISYDFTDIGTATNGLMPNNNSQHYWSGMWTGTFLCDTTGYWTWYLSTDDCGFMWLGDTLVCNYPGQHGKGRVGGGINLQAGQSYPMKIMMAEYGGVYGLDLAFIRPGTQNWVFSGKGLYFTASPRIGISGSQLANVLDGLQLSVVDGYMNNNTDYFKNRPLLSGTTQSYVTDFSNIGTATNNFVPDNNSGVVVSAQWVGYFFADATGSWKFSIATDDNCYVVIDGVVVVSIAQWVNRGQYVSGSINLIAGNYYTMSVQWGNGGGPFHAEMMFFSPKAPNSPVHNGKGHYFSNVPIMHTFDQNSIPASSAYSNLYGSFTSAGPTIQPSDNEILIVYPDVYNQDINLTNTIAATPIPDKSATLSIEWFGYFKPQVTGTYSFTLINNSNITHTSMLWVGDPALVTYNSDNANVANPKGSKSITGIDFFGVAQKTYPIRILYGQKNSSDVFNLNININVKQSSGIAQVVSQTGEGYLCFMVDSNHKQYEPIQMAFALRDDTNSNAVLKSCYVSPLNITNNYTNNENLRKTKVMQHIHYSDALITKNSSTGNSVCSLILSPDGNLTFLNSSNASIPVWQSSSGNSNCGTMCSSINGNITLSNISIFGSSTGQGVDLIGFFSINVSSPVDPVSKATYTLITMVFDSKSYGMMYPTPASTFSIVYHVGNTQLTKNVNAKDNITVDNLAATQAVVSGGQTCFSSVNANCQFTLRLTNDGNISIYTTTKEIWNSSSLSLGIPPTSNLQSVTEWILDAAANNNHTMTSASYAKPFDTTPFASSTMGPNGSIKCLYSPNCKFKLTVESNNLMIKYALTMPSMTSTSNDGSNTFVLYSVFADEKLGQSFVANMGAKTLYPVDTATTSFFNKGTTYQKSASQYSFPPANTTKSTVDSRTYTAHSNTDLAACQSLCNSDNNCSHLYSYKSGNSTNCMINSDNKSARYYPNAPTSGITSSDLYIRDKMISSTCRYSFSPYTDTARNISTLTDNGSYNAFGSDYSILQSDSSMPKILSPSTEGACGNAVIQNQLVDMVGKPDAPYAYKNYSPSKTEGFASMGGGGGIRERFTPRVRERFPPGTKEGFASTIREGLTPAYDSGGINSSLGGVVMQSQSATGAQIDEANAKRIYISGYNKATHCSDLSTIMSNTGYMNECIATIKSNIDAIDTYSSEYGNNNVAIDQNYRDIVDMAGDVSGLYTSVNNPTKNDMFGAVKDVKNKYDPIDYSGNLVYNYGTKTSPELKDAMLDDMNSEIIQQNAMYVMGTMTVASLLIFVLMISK